LSFLRGVADNQIYLSLSLSQLLHNHISGLTHDGAGMICRLVQDADGNGGFTVTAGTARVATFHGLRSGLPDGLEPEAAAEIIAARKRARASQPKSSHVSGLLGGGNGFFKRWFVFVFFFFLFPSQRQKNFNFFNFHQTRPPRLLLSEALATAGSTYEGWSEARIRAWSNRETNPNAYYYR
jgi:hypothetical protein